MQTANSAHVCTPKTPAEYIESLPAWDGVPRLQNWLLRVAGSNGSTSDLANQRLAGSVLLIDMTKRALHPGCNIQHIPLVVGPQGSGKLLLLHTLAGPWFSNGNIMDTCEPGEVLGTAWLQPADVNYIGADQTARFLKFARSTRDEYRPSFAAKTVSRPRHPIIAMVGDHAPEWTKQRGIYQINFHRPTADIEYLQLMRDMLFAEAKAILSLEC